MEAKAILDLIPILNIRKLVLGTSKANLRYKNNPSTQRLSVSLYLFYFIRKNNYYIVICICFGGGYFRKIKSRRASGTIDQILKNAPEFCELKIICEGKEALDLSSDSLSPSPRAYNLSPQPESIHDIQDHVTSDSFRCGCFKLKG